MRNVWVKFAVLFALLLALAAPGMAKPEAEGVEKAVVLISFDFEGGDSQAAMGLVVGQADKPSRYVLTDRWYLTDDTGETEASSARVISLVDFMEYEVETVYTLDDSRLILLETAEDIEGSGALRFADPVDFGVGSRVYPVELLAADPNLQSWQVDGGVIESIQSVGQIFDELLADIRVEDGSGGNLYSVALDELGLVTGFFYDYSDEEKIDRVFPSGTIMDALDSWGVPYGVAVSVDGALAWEEEEESAEETGEPVSWADPEFGRMVEEALGHTPTDAELRRVRSLYLMGNEAVLDGPQPEGLKRADMGGVTSLNDLSYFPNLTDLWVLSQPIEDISPVAGCGELEFAALCYCRISDVSPLAGLTNLVELYLYDNRIVDISPLSALVGLDSLGLGVNGIGDVSPLSGLSALTFLRVHNNRIRDFGPLSELKRLEDLTVSGNDLRDLSPFAGLNRLEWLAIDDNMVSDLSPLSGLTRLVSLDAADNNISDLSPLSGLKNLTTLDIRGNAVTDLSPLAGLDQLNELYVGDNPVTDYSPVEFVEGLVTE